MGFLKNFFKAKEERISSNEDFWAWFKKNEKEFFGVVKSGRDIEQAFFDKLSPKLAELKDGCFCLTGMLDDHTAELILTAEGNTRNIAFVEELVASAPNIAGWKFVALKPPVDIVNFSVEMNGFEFSGKNLSFYSNEVPDYPDEVDFTFVHDDLNGENKDKISKGIYVYLDNYLGELNFLNHIDHMSMIGKGEAKKDLIPIGKLNEFLIWRQKEYLEKYDAVRYDSENDQYAMLESALENGAPVIAMMNMKILDWDHKASHPWIAELTFKYNGTDNGLPNDEDFKLLNAIEDEVTDALKENEGYLNVGRQTSNGSRVIWFACHDFRLPSKVLYMIQRKYSERFEVEFDIYKDKYWRTFECFRNS